MVTVIIPVYNVDKYLRYCVDSILGQTYLDFEILLIDDGSTDHSPVLCNELAEEHDCISSYHKVNGGLSSARNYGVERAKGEWVTFVDPDDYVSSTYLEDLVGLINKFGADMAITHVTLETLEETVKYKPPRFDDYVVDSAGAFYTVYAEKKVNWSACGKLIRKESILHHPFPDGYYEDSASAYLYIYDCDRIAIGDYSNNYHYIHREGSITAREYTYKHDRIFEVSDEIAAFIKEHYPQWDYVAILMYQNAVLQLLNRLSMPWKKYCEIFKKYRKTFRKNLGMVLSQKDISRNAKIYAIILSTSPVVLKMQRAIMRGKRGW